MKGTFKIETEKAVKYVDGKHIIELDFNNETKLVHIVTDSLCTGERMITDVINVQYYNERETK